jgi:hypothetical protein
MDLGELLLSHKHLVGSKTLLELEINDCLPQEPRGCVPFGVRD